MGTGWIIAWHFAVKGDLIVPQLSAFQFFAVSVRLGVPITEWGLNVVIDVGSFQHPSEILRYPVQDDPRLRVSVDVFVASSRNCRRAGHQLADHKNDEGNDHN